MIRFSLILLVLLLLSFQSNSQHIINGSFDTSPSEDVIFCTSYSNVSDNYEFFEDNVVGFQLTENGYMGRTTFYNISCAYINETNLFPNGMPDGDKCLGLLGTVLDMGTWISDSVVSGCSLELTDSLVFGATYNLSFYKSKEDSIYAGTWPDDGFFIHNACPFRIGLSNDPSDFGEEIYFADTTLLEGVQWEYEEFEFFAPFPANYITIETVPTLTRTEVYIDNFVLNYVRDPLPDIHTPDSETDSHTGGVGDTHENVILDIYPNPNNGIFTLKSNTSFINRVVIYNQLGQQVAIVQLSKRSSTLDLSHLNSGVYYITGEGIKPERILISKN